MTSPQHISQSAIQHVIEFSKANDLSRTKAQDFQITPWHHDPMGAAEAECGGLR